LATEDVGRTFEEAFLSQPLSAVVARCDTYELAPLFADLCARNQPVLEAGCGSGKWAAWLADRGVSAVGLDWSEALCERARREVPKASFIAGDLRAMPFDNQFFGAILALGSVEHVSEGPLQVLREFRRVLRPRGVAVVTVPFGGRLYRTLHALKWPYRSLRSSGRLRALLGKRGAHGRTRAQARCGTRRDWYPESICLDGGWTFYQYHFDRIQMRGFLKSAGLEIQDEFVSFAPEGVLSHFGRIAGVWNPVEERADLTPIGQALLVALPERFVGHMLCYVLRKE